MSTLLDLILQILFGIWDHMTNTPYYLSLAWFWFCHFLVAVPHAVWYAAAGFAVAALFIRGLIKYEERSLTQDVHLIGLAGNYSLLYELFTPIRKQVMAWQQEQATGKSLGHELITKLEETSQIVEIQAGKIREEMKKHVEAQMEAYRNEVLKARGEFKAQVLLLIEDLRAEMKTEVEAIVEQRISEELKKRVTKRGTTKKATPTPKAKR